MLMLNQLTEEQRLTKAVVSIMGNPRYTALSGVMMIGAVVLSMIRACQLLAPMDVTRCMGVSLSSNSTTPNSDS